jgi:diguanylate cyclase (GGDEF)-like protein
MHPAPALHVVLIEDNDIDAFLLGEMLAHAKAQPTHIDRATTLAQGLERLGRGDVDLVLLDLTLPDSQYLETIHAVASAFPALPVIVCTASDDEAMALEAVRYGAQDYLVKGQVTVDGLTRAMRYAIERQRMLLTLRDLSLVDELTGLYNRRGFQTLVAGHLKQASRSSRRYVLVCGDLDGLKPINDTWGHKAGDDAIRAAAQILRQAFRSSDVLARMGGDEFAVLALETCDDFDAMIADRLEAGFAALNGASARPYSVEMSIGMHAFMAQPNTSVEEMLSLADGALYEEKRLRQASGRRSMGAR